MRKRCCWAFSRARYRTDDLALWWEVARRSALRTPDILFLMCAARSTHANQVLQVSSRGRQSRSQVPVFLVSSSDAP